ncbi:bifunctional riboflavin kinase/FAD synthetase [Halobacteriovorax sp. HLS]|uniref:bifunctional riboflavin kinase/FAD synthetase n=1 Tax=Halobacteriovorax sp. HLS TaxID=2234000 RepID=UPI000FD9F8A7|nr:bifunctional riboflavin kinase/FAD synthetase [Halobacteriovorax sp. HLS]
MKKISSLKEISNETISITMGNFDGVHLGHQSIIKSISSLCKENGTKFVLITFNPHPMRILSPKDNFLINTYSEKYELLKNLGVDYFYEIPFTRDLSTLSPSQFLEDYLLKSKQVKFIYMGHDFTFGANKKGDFSFVQSYCSEINIVKLDEFKKSESDISSSRIRKSINEGDVEHANKLLGREFFLSGTVVKGAGRGRQIGFPTANIEYNDERITPAFGVYITTVEVRGMIYHSITNIGINPTFNETNLKTVETNIFDFSEDIYGEELKVKFHKRVRDEKKFSSVNELVEQISNDVSHAKAYFKS